MGDWQETMVSSQFRYWEAFFWVPLVTWIGWLVGEAHHTDFLWALTAVVALRWTFVVRRPYRITIYYESGRKHSINCLEFTISSLERASWKMARPDPMHLGLASIHAIHGRRRWL